VTSSSVMCLERLEFPGVLRRYSVNKSELLRTGEHMRLTYHNTNELDTSITRVDTAHRRTELKQFIMH
jgi:hypothetical protein